MVDLKSHNIDKDLRLFNPRSIILGSRLSQCYLYFQDTNLLTFKRYNLTGPTSFEVPRPGTWERGCKVPIYRTCSL